MYYVLYKPRGTEEPWTELPNGIRNYPKAKDEVKALVAKTNENGSKAFNVKLCVGKDRNRRDLLRL